LSTINEKCSGLTKSGKREFAKEMLLDMFAPYAKFMCQKQTAMELREKGSIEYDELLSSLPTLKDPAEIKRVLARMEAIDAQLESERMIAFASHDQPTQDRFIAASDYADEFINLGPGYTLCAWYVCLADHGGQWPCRTFALAKAWPRKHEDPLAFKQTWSCPCYECAVRYRTKFGMVSQMTIRGTAYWFRTPVKDWDTLDMQAWGLEQFLAKEKLTSPEKLYASLPAVRPIAFDELFTPTPAHKLKPGVDPTMVFTFKSKEVFESLPVFEWMNIFAIFHVDRYHGKSKLV
jgi:hypothetical protein